MLETFPENRSTVVGNIFVFVPFDQRNKSIGAAVVKVIDGREAIYRLGAIPEETVEKGRDVLLGLIGVDGQLIESLAEISEEAG